MKSIDCKYLCEIFDVLNSGAYVPDYICKQSKYYNSSNQTTKVTYGVKSIRVKRSEWLNASSAAEVWDMAIAAMNDADQTWGIRSFFNHFIIHFTSYTILEH